MVNNYAKLRSSVGHACSRVRLGSEEQSREGPVAEQWSSSEDRAKSKAGAAICEEQHV